jgi:intein/homing endonuclease
MEIDQIIDSKTNDQKTIEDIADRLWKYRQSGLSKGGEFSVENLTFKALRNNGYIDKIREYARRTYDKSLSLESIA